MSDRSSGSLGTECRRIKPYGSYDSQQGRVCLWVGGSKQTFHAVPWRTAERIGHHATSGLAKSHAGRKMHTVSKVTIR
jgi:hypothetical protein